jgi:DNA-binding MarR family transcriptional regulator
MPNRERKKPGDARRLDDTLEFLRLIWAVDHGLQTTSKSMRARHGVTGPQRLAIRIVAQWPNISASELARILHLDPSTLTGVLRRLESNGFLSRRPDPLDARRARLALTPRGRELLKHRTGTVESAVQRTLRRTPPHMLAAAARVLTSLARALGTKDESD